MATNGSSSDFNPAGTVKRYVTQEHGVIVFRRFDSDYPRSPLGRKTCEDADICPDVDNGAADGNGESAAGVFVLYHQDCVAT